MLEHVCVCVCARVFTLCHAAVGSDVLPVYCQRHWVYCQCLGVLGDYVLSACLTRSNLAVCCAVGHLRAYA